jgi:hypothetical protein
MKQAAIQEGYRSFLKFIGWQVHVSPNKKATNNGCGIVYLVEFRGIEPLTSSLPAKRSPS